MHIKQILWERCIGKIVIAMLFTLIWATMGNKSALATMTHANRTLNEVTHQWHLVNFQEDFSGNPIVITSIETYDGSDPSGIRIQELNKGSMEVMIEEEQPYSVEMEHTSEIVSYFAAEEGFLRNTNGSIIGEAGRVIKDQADPTTWHTVNTQKTYTNPVVFAQISTYNGSNPSHIRLKNVKNNSFEMQREEWDYLDGEHTTEDIGYIVMERGSHELAFGKKLEVGITTTNDNWKNIYFQQNFNDVPITISRCQTYNGKQAVVTRQNNVKTSGFSVRLQEEEGNDDKHAIESIGYMAFVNIGSIQGDTIEPIVDKFYANPTTVNTNDSIMIGYTVTDETALKQVELYRKIDGGNWTKEKVQSVSGISDSGVFKDSIPNAGTYYYGIHVVGQANNIGKDRIKVIVNNPMGDNAPPSVNAGQDQSVTLPALVNRLVNLNGTVTDDNKPNPPSTVTVRWSKIRGPNNGVVVFGNATKKDTTASFSVAGIYELKLTANDSELTASDNVITTVTSTTSAPELKPYSSNKFYWQYKGRPVLLIGGFTGTHNMHVKPDDLNPPGNLTALMNKMVSAGGNYIRANFDPGKAILQGFPASHVKVNGKYNLNRLTSETDPISYWGKFNTLLAEAKKRNIIVQIEIDESGLCHCYL